MNEKCFNRIKEIENEIFCLEKEKSKLHSVLYEELKDIGWKEILHQNYDKYFLPMLKNDTNFYPFVTDDEFSLYSLHKDLFDNNVVIEKTHVPNHDDHHCSYNTLFVFSANDVTAFQGIYTILGKAFVKHKIIFYEKFDLNLNEAKNEFLKKYFSENKLSYSFEYEAAKNLDKLKLIYQS